MLGRRHTVRAHFWQTAANYTQTGGGLILGIALARLLEPKVFGELVSITAMLMMLMIPLSFSAAQLLVSDGGKTQGLFERVMGMVWIITGVKFIILVAYMIWALMEGDARRAVIALILGIPMAMADWQGVIRSDLEGRGQFKPNFFVQTSGVTVQAIISIGFVIAGWGIYGLALGGFAAFVPQLLIYIRETDRPLMRANLNRSAFLEQLQSGLWLWLNYISTSWFSRIDKVILGKFGGDMQLGLYNRAFNYGPISHMLLDSLMTNATVRAIATQERLEGKRKIFFRTMAIVLIGGAFNGFFWWGLASVIVPFVFGGQWMESVPAFQWLGWLSMAYLFSHGSATVLLAERRYKMIALIRTGGLAVLAILLLWQATQGGLDAAGTSKIYLFSLVAYGIPMSMMSLKSLYFGRKNEF